MKIENINLEWKGHSCFLIQTEDKNIYIDPYKLKAGSGNIKADVILITHSHYDHCSIEDLRRIVKDGTIIIGSPDCTSSLTKLEEKLDVKVIEPGKGIKIENIKIGAVPAYNTNKSFHSKSEYWNGYLIDIDGLKIYHAGDTDIIPEMSKLSKIDIALLPIDGKFTMNAEEAVKSAKIIKPKIAIPMHYGTLAENSEDAKRFAELCKQSGINAEILPKE